MQFSLRRLVRREKDEKPKMNEIMNANPASNATNAHF